MVEIFMKFCFNFYLVLLVSGKLILCVPVEYDVGNESYDLDTEQSEARYDPRLLSEELRGSHRETQQGAEACISSELRYEHGQKISRTDPCEVCLCVDGEVFCWWKQCESNQVQTMKFSSSSDITSTLQSSQSSAQTARKISSSSHNRNNKVHSQTKSTMGGGTKSKYMKYQHSNKNKNKYLNTNYTRKNVSNFPKGILSFPINLPLHIPLSDLDGQLHQQQPNNNISDGSHKTHGRDDNEMTTTINESFETITTTTQSITTNSLASTTMAPNEMASTILAAINETINPSTINTDDDDEYSELQLKHIKIDDITTGQHYVITSSGNVENDDLNLESNVLASDSVISQFNGNKNFMDTPTSFTTTSTGLPSLPLAISTASETLSPSLNYTTELSINSLNSNNNKLIVNSFNNVNNNIYNNNNNSNNSDNSNISSITPDDNPTDYDIIIGNATTTTKTTTMQDGLLQPSSSSPSPLAASVAGNDDGTTTQLVTTTIVTTEVPREENCIVMGVTYKIGTILPQETGNCLQCICIEGANPTVDPPRVTCNPHNCPPLILPDLFDTTGY